jgi:hypothetical protein
MAAIQPRPAKMGGGSACSREPQALALPVLAVGREIVRIVNLALFRLRSMAPPPTRA